MLFRKLHIMQIEINQLSKFYGKQQALNNISFSFSENETLGLLGPNGAGKSTLMKILTGLQSPDEGGFKVIRNGEAINFKAFKKNFGYLPENNPLYENMYVKEYLLFVANLRKLKPQKVDEVIEQVGLTLEKHKLIKSLSKGYRQRVGIAQAIIHEPELLILDEPTNGLDPNQIIEIRNVIKEIGRAKTVIISTHLMQEVEALCSRVVLLKKGNLMADENIQNFKGQHSSLEEAFHQMTNL